MDNKTDNRILRNVSLELEDYQSVKEVAKEKGFGGKGFSTAIRYIIRDWKAMKQERENKESKAEQA